MLYFANITAPALKEYLYRTPSHCGQWHLTAQHAISKLIEIKIQYSTWIHLDGNCARAVASGLLSPTPSGTQLMRLLGHCESHT